LPKALDRRELAAFVLTTMEGAVMQARTYRELDKFDGSVRQLRAYFDFLQQPPSRTGTRRPAVSRRAGSSIRKRRR
jgi:hypothetical protein